MEVSAKTDVGKARDNNQDYYYVQNEGDVKLYILADGMGGYTGGEIASKLAVESVKKYIEENFEENIKKHVKIEEILEQVTQYANKVVYEKAKSSKDLEEMGTTLEICLIYKNEAYFSHIGDSRVYIIKEKQIMQLTKDHSYVQKLVNDGTITKEEAKNHPKKNMLLNALGCTEVSKPDILTKKIKNVDYIVICSDGLTNMVEEDRILQIINENGVEATSILIEEANKQGGYDNITIIIIAKK